MSKIVSIFLREPSENVFKQIGSAFFIFLINLKKGENICMSIQIEDWQTHQKKILDDEEKKKFKRKSFQIQNGVIVKLLRVVQYFMF